MSAPARGDTADDAWRAQQLRALFDAVARAPHEHDFFALLRHIEALSPNSPRFGRALRSAQEPLRLGQKAELAFPVSSLAKLEAGRGVPRLGVLFFGLFGPQGPMPLHLTEYVRERARQHGDLAPERFFDVFHHRMLSLFYRAWVQGQPAVQHDRPAEDRFAAWVGAAAGLGAVATDDVLPGTARLHQVGLLGQRSRNPEGLARILSRYFRLPVRIEENVPHWMKVGHDDRMRLGYARNRVERAGTPARRLGVSATAGSKVWDRAFKFRVVLGPLDLAQYLAFRPGSKSWLALEEWVHQYAGLDLLWDVELVLARAHVPEPQLGHHVQLGLTTWAGRRARDHSLADRQDLRLRPGAAVRQAVSEGRRP